MAVGSQCGRQPIDVSWVRVKKKQQKTSCYYSEYLFFTQVSTNKNTEWERKKEEAANKKQGLRMLVSTKGLKMFTVFWNIKVYISIPKVLT